MVCVDIWYGIDDIPAEMGPTSVTIGVFDGLHRGHQQLISACESCGLIFEDSVSATTCDVLVAWDPASMSRKARTARELGIPIVSFADFEDWHRYYTGSPYETFLADILEEGHQVAFRGSIVINGIHVTAGARMADLCDELGLVYLSLIHI